MRSALGVLPGEYRETKIVDRLFERAYTWSRLLFLVLANSEFACGSVVHQIAKSPRSQLRLWEFEVKAIELETTRATPLKRNGPPVRAKFYSAFCLLLLLRRSRSVHPTMADSSRHTTRKSPIPCDQLNQSVQTQSVSMQTAIWHVHAAYLGSYRGHTISNSHWSSLKAELHCTRVAHIRLDESAQMLALT